MWLAVLMLAAMASGSRCPDGCQCFRPRVECHGHTPYASQFDGLPSEFTELVIRDVTNDTEFTRMRYFNSSFFNGFELIEITNITNKNDTDDDHLGCHILNIRYAEDRAFPNVRMLNYSHNSFVCAPSDCPIQLRVLDLGHNKITKITIPFNNCKNLTWLNLGYNKIDDIRSNVFADLNLLEYLDLSENNLHTLQEVLHPLTSLQRLFLAGNKFEHIGSTWFQNLTKLVELDVSRNKLVLIPPDALKPLTSLSIIRVDGNCLINKNFSHLLRSTQQYLAFTPALEHTTLTPSTTSTTSTATKSNSYVWPQYCQLRSPTVECHGHVPKSMQPFDELPDNFNELVIHNLENTWDTWRFENSTFLDRLLSLEITNASRLDVDIRIFIESHVPRLRSLNISYNAIERDSYLMLVHDELSNLDVGHNNINKLYATLYPRSLKWLNLANNKIDYIKPYVFSRLSSLEYLDLSENNLHTLHEILYPLISLQRLFLAGNKLEHIGSTWFQNLTKLVELDVSRNKLTFILADPLQPLVSLSVLKLAENPLIKRDLSLLLSTGKRLEIVDASRIGLSRVPAALTHSIRLLKLAGNQLTSINGGDFDSYPLLRELDLADNRLISIEEDALGRLDNLEELNLSGNILSSIPKSLPNGLKTLDLSQNALYTLKVNDLQNLRLLTELKLSGNVITEIEAGFFRQLIALKTLDISDNPFVKLPSDTLNGPSNLLILRMSGLSSLKTEENQNQDTAFPFLTPENLVKLDVSRSPALAAQLLADNAALSACKSLRELDLAYTSISSIRSDLAYVLPQLEILNLLGNDWNCSEDQLWLGEWIRQHNASAEFSARCKTPLQYEGQLLHHIVGVASVKDNRMSFSTVSPVTTIFSKIENVPFTTDLTKQFSSKSVMESTTVHVTSVHYNLKTKKKRDENDATQVSETTTRISKDSSTTNNEKESINLSTVTYAKEETSDVSTKELPTRASIQSTTQTIAMKNNQNKLPSTMEQSFTFSTFGIRLNKKEPRSVYITTPLTRNAEETTRNVPTTASSSTVVRLSTTDATPVTTGTVLLMKLKESTTVKLEESTASSKSQEIKKDVSMRGEEKQQQQHKLTDRVFSEFSHSKLLFANEEAHANEELSSSSSSSSSSNSFAEELRNRQTSESGARMSAEFLASGAHPGMLVLLGAAIVAAAALTVVLSRRATVNRRERLYQRHENIEVHALTPTTELW